MTAADALFGEIGAIVAEAKAESGTPGVAYGVVVDGEARSAGIGVTRLGDDAQEVTSSTLFRICSLTKPMTSTLVMSLVEDGILDLDVPIATWLPDLELADRDARDDLTLRHLLLHTSGLEGEWRGDLFRYGSNDDAIERLVADYSTLGQYAPPGVHWGYCNTGYWLAGAIVARVTGHTYERSLRERVLDPLEMTATALSAEEAILGRVALPHRPVDGGQHPVRSFALPRARVASGGVISSVDDLLRFAAMHLTDPLPDGVQLLDEASVAALQVPGPRAAMPSERQSLGWATIDVGRELVVGHSGSYDGYAARIALVPSKRAAVVVLTNSDSGGRVGQAVLHGAQELLLGASVLPRPFVDVPHAELRRLEGRYVHPSVDRTEVRIDADCLSVEMNGPKRAGTGYCRATSATDFTVTEGAFVGTEIQFLRDEHGVVDAIRVGNRLGARVGAL